MDPGIVFKTLYCFRILRIGQIDYSVYPWKAFPALYCVTV
jgi:hypothetical protein